MSDILFTVVIPAFNSEDFLLQCLHSLDMQSFKNFEVIIIDDGSTDGTPVIADKWCSDRLNARCIHKKNEGLLLARRDGIKASNGLYISFLDSDDEYSVNCLSKCASVVENYYPDIIAFNYYRNPLTKVAIANHGLNQVGLYKDDRFELIRAAALSGEFNNLSCKVVRKDIYTLDQFDYYSNCPGLMHGEDWLQTINVINNSNTLYYINDPLYYYRINQKSSTAKYNPHQLDDISYVLKYIIDLSSQWGSEFYSIALKAAANHLFYLIHPFVYSRVESIDMSSERRRIKTSFHNISIKNKWPYCYLRLDRSIITFSFFYLPFPLFKSIASFVDSINSVIKSFKKGCQHA